LIWLPDKHMSVIFVILAKIWISLI